MKNIFFKSAALVAALAMTMSGCSNEELTGDNGQTGEMKGISSITLETPQGGPSTRLEYNTDNITQALGVKWRAGKWENANSDCERALVLNANNGSLDGAILARSDDGAAISKAEFKFYKFNQSSGQSMYQGSIGLLYPYKSDYSTAFDPEGSGTNTVEATLPLSGQTGALANMQNFDYMTATAIIESDGTETDANLNVAFKHRIAIMRLTGLTFPAGTTGTATNISISGTGLMTDAKLTFTKGANNTLTESLVLGNTEGAITSTGTFSIANNVLGDVYICFFPGNADATGTHKITGLKVTATVGSDTYEYNYGADAAVSNKVEQFVEGKMYTLKDKMMTKKAPAIIWAEGNLIADGANGAKIGASTDGGLYFQFGSLVGWSTAGSPTVAVSPVVYTNTKWRNSWVGDPATDNALAGTGDPCRYYLKGTWRLPTKDEYVELFKNQGYPSTGPWKWENSSVTNKTLGITFPASGCRSSYNGSLGVVGTNGSCWSASPSNASDGYSLSFSGSNVFPGGTNSRAYGLPVRCVQASL